jgi:uncharacterized membrane protein
MDTHEVLLILHLVGAFLMVAGAGASTALAVRAATTTSTRVIAEATHLSRQVQFVVLVPGSIAVIVFGTWLAAHLDRDLGEAWLSASYALWLIATALGPAVLGRHAQRVNASALALIADGVEDSETLRREANETLPKAMGVVMNLFFVAFIYLMVVQPGA